MKTHRYFSEYTNTMTELFSKDIFIHEDNFRNTKVKSRMKRKRKNNSRNSGPSSGYCHFSFCFYSFLTLLFSSLHKFILELIIILVTAILLSLHCLLDSYLRHACLSSEIIPVASCRDEFHKYISAELPTLNLKP